MINTGKITEDQIDWVGVHRETAKPEGMSVREFITGLSDDTPNPVVDYWLPTPRSYSRFDRVRQWVAGKLLDISARIDCY